MGFALVVLSGAVFVPVFAPAVAAGANVRGPGLAGVGALAWGSTAAVAVALADELVLVGTGVASLALAFLELVADLVFLLGGVVGLASAAAALDEGGGGSLKLLLD